MSKSSKPSRFNDDKNYHRKVMNAPQKANFQENLKQLHDPRNNVASGAHKQSTVTYGKKFKSRLRSPAKSKISLTPPLTSQTHSQLAPNKSADKRSSFPLLQNPKQYNTMKVHQDNNDSIMIHQTKASKKEIKQSKITKPDDNVEKDKGVKVVDTAVEQTSTTATNTNGKSASVELVEQELPQSQSAERNEKANNECVLIENCQQIGDEITNKIEPIESDQNNLNGHSKIAKPSEEELIEIAETTGTNDTHVSTECEKVKEENEEKEDKQSTVVIAEDKEQIDNNECASGSDLVGSTTSESSPIKDTENQINKRDQNINAKDNDDVSLISYDSNIMLKDVQIKLNDCLKENSKLLDVTDPNASTSEAFKDLSFGRTLRGISGRNSLRRMKHVTVRERLLTPNDSLFVNTSGTSSMLLDQSRYSELNSASPYNSNIHDRKRKLDEDDGNETLKKAKTDENYGLLNTSLEYLKSLRKPIQVSTPNAHGYKFNLDDKKANADTHTIAMEQMVEPKKWCVVM